MSELDEFLARPLTARVATDGPTVRPILSGPWSQLPSRIRRRPRITLTVDVCEPAPERSGRYW
jgi:hypothetical protein